MASGYTSGVADGKIKTFEEFALTCARAFGACVTLRDSDAPIPQAFEPDPYHKERAAEARKMLAELQAMTDAQKQAGADEFNAGCVRFHNERRAQKKAIRQRYDDMLKSVRDWTPPTGEHIKLKEFMEKQLLDSIEWDCLGKETPCPPAKTAEQWWSEQIGNAVNAVAYHDKEHEDECKRARDRTAWVAALRESLKPKEVSHANG